MKNDTPDILNLKDPFDELLRGADEYISDNGFTARVLTALPAGRRHSWRRFGMLSVVAFVCVILVAWQLPAVILLLNSIPKHWSTFQWRMLLTFVPLLTALASLGWVMFAIASEEE